MRPEFLAELNAAGTKLIYSALYPSGTIAQSVAVDPSGVVHTAGSPGFISAIAPTVAPIAKIFALQNAAGAPAVTARVYGPGRGDRDLRSRHRSRDGGIGHARQ